MLNTIYEFKYLNQFLWSMLTIASSLIAVTELVEWRHQHI